MPNLFEKQDSLNAPIEVFVFDTTKNEFPVKQHWHYFAEFIYVLKGKVLITCADKLYTVCEGELMVLPPMSVHSLYSEESDTTEPPVFIGLKFDPGKFKNMAPYAPSVTNVFRYAESYGMQKQFSAGEAEKLNCLAILEDCLAESAKRFYGTYIILHSQICRLVTGIIRIWIDSGLDIDQCPVESGESYGIENITEYIDGRLSDNIHVTEIAEKCHMSYSGFAAKFHEQYGMSCKEYIEQMRIFKAEEYLLFTSHDLNHIAAETGFADCSHFIRSYRKHRGMTPRQFRQQKKQSV